MAGLLDLFSGRSSDIYGNGLLTPEQRGGLGNIGLLALAGKLGQLAGPSFSPVPDFGAALGQAAGAYGASQEGAGTAALNAILTGQKGRKLEQELDYYKQLGPILGKLAGQWPGADGGAGGGEGSGSTGGGAAAPLSAGGGGGGGSDPRGMIPHIQAEAARLGIDPAVALKVARSEGLGTFYGDGGKSGGAFQLYTGGGVGNDFQRDTGLDPLDPKNEKATITYALEHAVKNGWGAWNGAKKLGITGFAGIGKPGAAPTAAAPAGPGGLLNLPQVPNFSSRLGGAPLADVGETVAPADVLPNRVGRFAGVAPGTPVNSRGFPYNPEITDPAVAARVAQSMAAIKQAQQSGVPWAAPRESSGSSAAAPADIYAGTDTPQGPMGDPGPAGPTAMASGLLMPGGPLTRGGVPGLPAMPPAAAPAADPSQLGPLAAPAPAAAAPAAPGPGLLSPPGAAPAAALPRGANPAYDAFLRNAGIASVLAKGAGLPGLDSLIGALKDSPSYQAELERARQRVGVEFAGPKTTAEKTAAEPFAIAASQRELENALAKEGWRIENGRAIPIPNYNTVAEAKANAIALGQQGPKLDADLAAQGKRLLRDSAGNPVIVPITGGAEADARAKRLETTAQEQAKADVAAGTAPGLARETETQKGFAAQDTAARAQAIASKEGLYLLGDAREQLEGAGIFSGALANPKMTLAQYYSGLTGVPNEQLINTQVFLQQAGARAAAILQSGTYGTGTGVGQRDLDAANKLANGDNTVDLATIKRVFDLTEKTAHRKIEMFNDMIRKRDPSSIIEPPSVSAYRPGTVPAGLPPGSVPAGNTKDGKPAFRSPDGKIWSE